MPRFFIDTDQDSAHKIDVTGLIFGNADEARAAALRAIPMMGIEGTKVGDHHSFGVMVRDSEGAEIYSASVCLIGGWKRHPAKRAKLATV